MVNVSPAQDNVCLKKFEKHLPLHMVAVELQNLAPNETF